MNLLKQTEGVWPVMARDGWPKNEKIFDDADEHPLLHGWRRWSSGHQTGTHEETSAIPRQGRWLGEIALRGRVSQGAWQDDSELDGRILRTGYSINPHWDAAIRSLPKHPITSGVKPFVLRDEWYYNMRWVDDMKDVTPILTAIPPDNTPGTPDAKSHPDARNTWHGLTAQRRRKKFRVYGWSFPSQLGR